MHTWVAWTLSKLFAGKQSWGQRPFSHDSFFLALEYDRRRDKDSRLCHPVRQSNNTRGWCFLFIFGFDPLQHFPDYGFSFLFPHVAVVLCVIEILITCRAKDATVLEFAGQGDAGGGEENNKVSWVYQCSRKAGANTNPQYIEITYT